MKSALRFIIKERVPFLIAIIIMVQNPFWPYWHYAALISFVFIAILFVVMKKSNRFYVRATNRMPLFLLSLFFVILPIVRGGIHISSMFYILCFALAYNFSKEDSEKAFKYVVRIIALVLSFSLPAWLLHTTGLFSFPLIGQIDLSNIKVQGADEGSTIMENYFLFVLKGGLDRYRFYSVFDEPGVLGTLGAYLLFAAKYNLSKWYNLVIFVSCLFTFSLAFYIISFCGYLYYATKSVRKFILLITAITLIIFFVYGFFIENELFVEKVLERSSNLGESLERRTGASASYFLENADPMTYLLGIGINRMSELDLLQGASYKLFLVENGFIALLVLIYAYIKLNPRLQNEIIVFNLLFWASFLQRPTAFLAWQIFIFAIITRILMRDRKTHIVIENNVSGNVLAYKKNQ